MRQITNFILVLALALSLTSVPTFAEKRVKLAIAVDQDTKPDTTFKSDVPKLNAFYIGTGIKAGDQLRGVWIAEDVGEAAPKNHTIAESTIEIKNPADQGAFTLSKPTSGWPVGDYRFDVYVGDKLEETVKFKVVAAGGTAGAPAAAAAADAEAGEAEDEDAEEEYEE